MSKVHLRLLLEVLREKLNQHVRLSISTAGGDHPTLHVQCSYKDYHMNRFDAHISWEVYILHSAN